MIWAVDTVGLDLDPSAEAWLCQWLLGGLASANSLWFQANPDAPCCIDCGDVLYREGPFTRRQTFRPAPAVLRAKRANCADACAYMAGKKLAEGVGAQVRVIPRGPDNYHAIVLMPDGSAWDPAQEMRR